MNASKDNFQPTHNPYIVGNPIRDKTMFFGREDEFAFIRKKITGGKKGGLLVLCGTRRSGKTSILFQIMNGRLGPEFFPVLIDMQAMTVSSDMDFLVKLAGAIIDALGDPEITLEKDFLEKMGSNPLDTFQTLISGIVDRLGGRKLILLFDEYEIFESYIDKKLLSTEVLNLFSNWVDHMEGVFIIFTGSDKIEERRAEYWERFLPKAVHYQRISFLGKPDTLRLIENPIKDVIHYEEGLPEKIYTLTAGQPFYTQVFCQALVDNLNERRKYDVAPSDLQEVIDYVVENPLPQMIFSWNSLSNIEKLALSIIGELNKTALRPVKARDIISFAQKERIGYRLDPALLNEALEKLFHDDMLNKETDEEAYSFKMDLWRLWIVRMHSKWKVIDEIKNDEGGLGDGITRQAGRRSRAAVFAMITVPLLTAAAFVFFNGRDNTATAPGVRALDSTWVTVRTNPPGANVILGNQMLGKSPVEHQQVQVTTAPLRIQLAGYRDYVDTLVLRKNEAIKKSIDLTERTGGLRLTSSPSGAQIYIDGDNRGVKTPSTIRNLPVNQTYEVRLVLAGYDPIWGFGIEVFEDSTLAIHNSFDRSTGQVQIASDPAGASVYVDDELVGQTPALQRLTHGRHRLLFVKDGYRQHRQNIKVPVQGNRIQVTMERLPPGTLVIMVTPWADVWVNGELKGPQTSRYKATLAPGKYTIRLSNPHFEMEERVAEVTSQRETVLNFRLKPTE